MPFTITREYIDNLQELIEQSDEKSVSTIVQPLHAADIAEIFNVLSLEEAKFLYLLLDGEKRADVIIELEEDRRERAKMHRSVFRRFPHHLRLHRKRKRRGEPT